MPRFSEGWIEWRGRRTWYRVVGDLDAGGTPLLCLHGGPGSTHHYFAPLEQLADEDRAVVVYDQLGCGRSDRPAGVEWRLEVFLEEVDALRTALGLDRVHLLGTSWGGMLALEHALARRDGVAGLVLGSTPASAAEWAAEARRLRDELPQDVVAVLERHERDGTVDDPEYARAMAVFGARHLYRGDPARDELRRMRDEVAPDVYRAMWGPNEWTNTGTLSGWDVRARLRQITVPTLVLRGRHDVCTSTVAATLVRGIPGAREVVFERSSHMPVLEESERYVAVVGDFLRQVERDRRRRHESDVSYRPLRIEQLADAGLHAAARLGAQYASVHVHRTRTGRLRVRDEVVEGGGETVDAALGVRLLHRGTWGYAATVDLTPAGAARTARAAAAVAAACRDARRPAGTFADEPAYPGLRWGSSYEIDPFAVPEAERAAHLAEWSARLLAAPAVQHVLALLTVVKEHRFYADGAGTSATQQRVRVHPMLFAFGAGPDGAAASLRTSGPPSGRGWEYLLGRGWDWDGELAELPDQLAAKLRARPVRPGRYDLVIDPSNLWLTLHETVGHATELDRALGYEAAYAGTTFAHPEELGTLRFGSALMNVIADRTTEHGLATVAVDDEGVVAQSWVLVEDGVLVGFQTDRRTAAFAGASRSTGCAFAESALYPPLARMPNVSLQPDAAGPPCAGLLAGVEDGIYVVGSDSWSIDARREHFQFTAQRCHRIRSGRLAGQLSGVAYRGRTTEFWAALEALGGASTFGLYGADLCGKGQPVQSAAASHGCPAAVFRGIRVENAARERGE